MQISCHLFTLKQVRSCVISIKENDIPTIIRNLDPNKSHGWDNLSVRVIKLCGDSLIYTLKCIFEGSLQEDKYPDCWKKANVVPVHKKECKSLIFERLIYKDLFNHFYCNNLFTKNQSGFMPGDSCIFQLLSIVHEINSFFDCNPTIDIRGVFLDISKACDKVWHEGLLFKLESYGIGGELLNLFKDYLKERQQGVVLNGQSSSWEAIKSAVPQGSVLGPLLFLIYTNDLSGGLSSTCKMTHLYFFLSMTSMVHVMN